METVQFSLWWLQSTRIIRRGAKKGVTTMETRNSIDAALSNAIILDNIFRYSSSPRTLRLVCKQWNDVILSGKSPPLTINLLTATTVYSLYTDSEESMAFLYSMDVRLFKRLTLSLDIYPIRNFDDTDDALKEYINLFVQICGKQGPHIRELKIIWRPAIVPALYTVLGDGLFPNLNNLEIEIETPYPDNFPLTGEQPPNIQTMSNLTKIKLSNIWPKNLDDIRQPNLVTTFFHKLLNAAPNLQKLVVKSFHCPDLEANKEIKEFRFQYNSEHLPWNTDPEYPIRDFNYYNNNLKNNLAILLEQVKDSLEILELNCRSLRSPCPSNHGKSSLKFPVMSKLLTFLYHETCSDDRLHPDIKTLLRDKMPSLIHLFIPLYGGEDDFNGSEVLDNLLLLQNHKIKRLHFSQVPLECGHEFIEKFGGLKTPFPDLETLELSLWRGDDGADLSQYECGIWVGNTLKYCSTLGLRNLRIKTDFSYGMNVMVNEFWECRRDLLTGLQTLELINGDFPKILVIDDLSPDEVIQLQEILIMTKNMTSLVFVGFLMQFDHTKRLLEVIADNKLPVRFLN